ncbi:MAG: ABC transporter ATP-binding protein [Oscillatoriales cyanobacterium RM1_1_9]|nr:ABC transporter ATP-binding protein [Oscillatoriales cyanobacterium SM2_3_0]NJO44158.1 ABC transporter ATP-binding protein [Oscillatoriales cyanobacterium RM2_1_1]NJO70916.1 ABC transporter ATP-binding protein [Oscillatoriales cyanobacterium RM1_1_9]
MIEVENLCKIYGTTSALKDISFAVEPGEILGFLGPNGAGKTTTLRILSGYLPATSGTARIAGYDVHEQSMAVRQKIGYLPESPPLYPDMTVEGFLHFVARLKQVNSRDRRFRVDAAIKKCGLLDRRKSLIRKLSKGYRQRVGIAQAIVHDPPVIVLDEPTVGLDPRQIIEVRNLIKSLAGDHTIILSTHILPEVTMTCSRVTIVNRGQVVATGSPETLVEELTAGTGYELEIDAGVTLGQLQGIAEIPGIKFLEYTAGKFPEHRQGIKVVCAPEVEVGPELVLGFAASGLNLYEMRRTRASLEDVFLQLTQQGNSEVEEPDHESRNLTQPQSGESGSAPESEILTVEIEPVPEPTQDLESEC